MGKRKYMKTILSSVLTSIAFMLGLGLAVGATFQNSSGAYAWPIYLPEPSNPYLEKQGNSAAGRPPGTQTYAGGLVSGSGYTAQLWAAPFPNDENAMVPVATTTFQSGPNAGFFVPANIMLRPILPPPEQYVLQVRVWDHRDGTVTSWAAALADAAVPRGKSPIVIAVVPGVPAPPTDPMTAFRSFNLHLEGGLRIDRSVIASGGGTSLGGNYVVRGTIGQPAIGSISGGDYSLEGGFWSAVAIQTEGAPLLSIAKTNGAVVVSWPLRSGWVLEQAPTITGTPMSWMTVPLPYVTNGNRVSVTTPIVAGHRFFRLHKP
jgi:hypothetical protein